MSLTLEEYREIITWYAKMKYYEQKYGNAAPPEDRAFRSSLSGQQRKRKKRSKLKSKIKRCVIR
jgi:hypothetical protein